MTHQQMTHRVLVINGENLDLRIYFYYVNFSAVD